MIHHIAALQAPPSHCWIDQTIDSLPNRAGLSGLRKRSISACCSNPLWHIAQHKAGHSKNLAEWVFLTQLRYRLYTVGIRQAQVNDDDIRRPVT